MSVRPSAGGNADPRMAGLPAEAIARLQAAARAIRDGAFVSAEGFLQGVLAAAPEHPEALRLSGILHTRSNRPREALDVLQRASAGRPKDALILNDLGSALSAGGERDAAFAAWRRATELAPREPMPWYNLGRSLQLEGRTEPALDALRRACELAPTFVPAQVLCGDALTYLGRFDGAEAAYRAALRAHPACGDAWRGLANIKVRPLSDDDRERLSREFRRADIAEPDRIAMGYALGKVCEDQGRYAEAFAALSDANARLRRLSPWSAQAFRAHVDAVLAQTETLPVPLDPTLGQEAIRGRQRAARSRRDARRRIGASGSTLSAMGRRGDGRRLAPPGPRLPAAHRALARAPSALHRQDARELALRRRAAGDAARREGHRNAPRRGRSGVVMFQTALLPAAALLLRSGRHRRLHARLRTRARALGPI